MNLINHDSKNIKLSNSLKININQIKLWINLFIISRKRFLYGLEMKNILEIDDIETETETEPEPETTQEL